MDVVNIADLIRTIVVVRQNVSQGAEGCVDKGNTHVLSLYSIFQTNTLCRNILLTCIINPTIFQ